MILFGETSPCDVVSSQMNQVQPTNLLFRAGNMLDALSARVSVQEAVTEQAVNYCYLALGAGFTGFCQAYVRRRSLLILYQVSPTPQR